MEKDENDIAIIGLAGIFPGSKSVEDFWSSIIHGNDCIYRKANSSITAFGLLDEIDRFDANFFNIPDKEAEILDPQHRLLLQTAWHAVEDASLILNEGEDIISCYCACAPSSYLSEKSSDYSLAERYQIMVANSPDFAATRIANKLGLTGEAINIATGCSSSLVAIHQACQSLILGQSNVSIVAGCTVTSEVSALVAEEGMILSKHGKCRPFDNKADGSIPGNAVGVVVLKRLNDAIANGDKIRAVIKSSAINNDGGNKIGFMAPSVSGQAEVIAMAIKLSGLNCESIGYVETHGTGTRLGDPVEIAALKEAFNIFTNKKNFCALGSVKANIGHTDRASGVIGLIKAVLCLENQIIPPLSNFDELNEEISLEDSPFYIPVSKGGLLGNGLSAIGVSSFGVGGTNAHAILEKAPIIENKPIKNASLGVYRLCAENKLALPRLCSDLANYIVSHPQIPLENIEKSCNVGRNQLKYKISIVASDRAELLNGLKTIESGGYLTAVKRSKLREKLVFLYSGHGEKSLNSFKAIYEDNDICKTNFDLCAVYLKEQHSIDLYAYLYSIDNVNSSLSMEIMQPFLFSIQYAITKYWNSMGIFPDAILGHSMGEITGAVVSGAFNLKEALDLIHYRGFLMDQSDKGAMMRVSISRESLEDFLNDDVNISVHNSDRQSVISGPKLSINKLYRKLFEVDANVKILDISIAAHSRLMVPFSPRLIQFASNLDCSTLKIPLMSNVTGTWHDVSVPIEAMYWGEHLCSPVLFHQNVLKLFKEGYKNFVEIGSGHIVSSLLEEIAYESETEIMVRPTFNKDNQYDHKFNLETIGNLCESGFMMKKEIYDGVVFADTPKYPFQLKSYWRKGTFSEISEPQRNISIERKYSMSDCMYSHYWKTSPIIEHQLYKVKNNTIIFLYGREGIATELLESFKATDHNILLAETLEDLETILKKIPNEAERITIVDCYGGTLKKDHLSVTLEYLSSTLNLIEKYSPRRRFKIYFLDFIRNNALTEVKLTSYNPAILGCLSIMRQEYPEIDCKIIYMDIALKGSIAELVLKEIAGHSEQQEILFYNGERYIKDYKTCTPTAKPRKLTNDSRYLITGGLGRVGLVIAQAIASKVKANIILLSRSQPNDYQLEIIAQINASGSKIYIINEDITNYDQFKLAISDFERCNGNITGIVHAAADIDQKYFSFLSDFKAEQGKRIIDAKVEGAKNIKKYFSERALEFIILCSSLSTEIGGLRFASYAAANAYLDMLVNEQGEEWQVIAWEAWKFNRSEEKVNSQLSHFAITPSEGMELFYRCLCAEEQRIIISTIDIRSRKTHSQETLKNTRIDSTKLNIKDPQYLKSNLRLIINEVTGSQLTDSQSFYDVGIDSLSVVRILSKIRSELGISIPTNKAFKELSLNGLLRQCENFNNIQDSKSTNYDFLINHHASTKRNEASSLQKRWFQMEKYNFGYILLPLILKGNLNLEALQYSFKRIVKRHSILRTTYEENQVTGTLIQIIKDIDDPAILVNDLRQYDPAQQKILSDNVIREIGKYRFQLDSEIPFKLGLIRLSECSILYLYAHHILIDGTSSTIFFDDLDRYYRSYLSRENIVTEDDQLQYYDYAIWHNQFLTSAEVTSSINYWRNHFEGAPKPLQLIGDVQDANAISEDNTSLVVEFRITSEKIDRIEKLVAASNSTVFNFFLAIYSTMIYFISDCEDFIIGTTLAGRSVPNSDKIFGVFVNPLPIRINLHGAGNFIDVLRIAQETMNGFHDNQLVPLEIIRTRVPIFHNENINSMFNVYILMQNYKDASHRIGDVVYEKYDMILDHQLMREFELIITPKTEPLRELICEFHFRKQKYSINLVNEWKVLFDSIIDIVLIDPNISKRSLKERLKTINQIADLLDE